MPNNNGSTRYHAEVKVMLQGRDVRINVFADTLAEIFRDLGAIVHQCPTAWVPPTDAGRELAAAELAHTNSTPAPATAPKATPKPKAQPAAKAPNTATPLCTYCGESESMELIEFTDKQTGKPRREWKCQACNRWHFPDRK